MKKTLATALLAAVTSVSGVALAQVSTPTAPPPQPFGAQNFSLAPVYADAEPAPTIAPAESAPAEIAPTAKRISGSIDMTIPSSYIARGLLLNDKGFIFEPAAELDFDFYHPAGGPINSVTGFIGGWSDLTDANPSNKVANLKDWYEFDWDFGVQVKFLDKWTASVKYLQLTSPSDAFHDSKNIVLALGYDDSTCWGANNSWNFRLNPGVALWFDTYGSSGGGAHTGGQLLEPGITPSITLQPTGNLPITIGMPIMLGLGFDDYYGGKNPAHDEFYGYFTLGGQVSIPVKMLDEAVGGHWTATAGVAYYNFGDGTRYANIRDVGRSSRDDVICSVGVDCHF